MTAHQDELWAAISTPELRLLDTLTVLSSLASVVGSSLLMMWLFQERRDSHSNTRRSSSRRSSTDDGWTSQHRFLWGLSAFDVIGSLGRYTLQPALRTHTPSAACTVQGAMTAVTFVAPLYNVSLALYYCHMIRHRGPAAAVFSKTWEPVLHVMSIGVPFFFLVTSVALEGMNPSGAVPACTPGPYPAGCDYTHDYFDFECERGDGVGDLVLYCYTPIFVLTWTTLITTNLLIFCRVRCLEANSYQWTLRSSSMLSASGSYNHDANNATPQSAPSAVTAPQSSISTISAVAAAQ